MKRFKKTLVFGIPTLGLVGMAICITMLSGTSDANYTLLGAAILYVVFVGLILLLARKSSRSADRGQKVETEEPKPNGKKKGKKSKLFWTLALGVPLVLLVVFGSWGKWFGPRIVTVQQIQMPPPWCDSLRVSYHKEGSVEWFEVVLSDSVPLQYFEGPDTLKWNSWQKDFLNPTGSDYVRFWFYGDESATPAYRAWQIPDFEYRAARARLFGHGHLIYRRTG